MMKFKFFGEKLEKEVSEDIEELISMVCTACEFFREAVIKNDNEIMEKVHDIENEGDIVRRKISLKIYEGAFLPYLRPNILKLAELVDEVLDTLEDAAMNFGKIKTLDKIREDVIEISNINSKLCYALLKAFKSLFEDYELRESTLLIRIYEKKVDEIKYDLTDRLIKMDVDFWQGKILSDFLDSLISLSDIIEDAADLIQMVHVSIR